MMRWLVVVAFGFGIFALASAVAAFLYGQFAAAKRGEPSHAFEKSPHATALDRLIAPELAARAGHSGLVLLDENVDAFAARALTARAAERSLDLMYYIWDNDLTGELLLNEVVIAAERGVRVRLLLDDIGVSRQDAVMRRLTLHPNIEVRLFNPTRARAGGLRRGLEMALRMFSVTRRMHNKAWIADGRLAIVGGRNIGDAYFDASEGANFRDMDLLTLGPVVAQIEGMFDEYWNSPAVLPIEGLRRAPRAANAFAEQARALAARAHGTSALPYLTHVEKTSTITSLMRDGIHWDKDAVLIHDPAAKALSEEPENWIMRVLDPVFATASREITITSPYFVPGTEGTTHLTEFPKKNISVKILTNSLAANDVAAVHGGYARYREALLQGGIELYELRATGTRERLSFRGSKNASLHTKAFTVDDTIGFIGSVNFDPRSASLNTEMGVMFKAAPLVAQLRALFEEEIGPDLSYRLGLDPNAALYWQDGDLRHTTEPNTSFARRLFARIVGWLPLESQL